MACIDLSRYMDGENLVGETISMDGGLISVYIPPDRYGTVSPGISGLG